ncbi:hypothetical protein TELCIR_12341 [Teladorsagia circumcincta]|uniref:Uncharacterized protein n=1 Tax=Teladorsagia circumcincta TaxID=45464 RepID=A0A2G9U8D9_TELCI|nr:hypothetical protein TELCIR_12341 [Teladorsagia circumcincta]
MDSTPDNNLRKPSRVPGVASTSLSPACPIYESTGSMPSAAIQNCRTSLKLYYNEKDTKRNGVAIAVAESLKDHVSAVNRVSDRIMAVRIDTKEGYWTILVLYAPQVGCPESEKDEFYLILDDAIRSVPKGDHLAMI